MNITAASLLRQVIKIAKRHGEHRVLAEARATLRTITESEGWVIVHPDGKLELNYFKTHQWTLVPNGKLVTAQVWCNRFRPGCTIVRMKLERV
jgi:hypothetical protein